MDITILDSDGGGDSDVDGTTDEVPDVARGAKDATSGIGPKIGRAHV